MKRPSGYPLRSLGSMLGSGDIVEIQDGNHGEKHPTSKDYVECGIPFLMASDITEDGRPNLVNCKFIPKELGDSLRIGFARRDDVLLTHKGTIGRVAIVPDVADYVMLTPQVTYYRVQRNRLCNRFLAFAFRHPDFQQRMVALSAQSTRPYIGITAQRQLEAFCPSLHTQRKIASILSAYDDLIENNARRIAILEAMAQAIYREWFVEFRFPGHEKVKLVHSPLGMIPSDWKWRELTEHGFVGRGKSRHRPRNESALYGGPYPFFQTGDIKAARTFLWKHSQTYSEAGLAQSKLWEPGTLCITIAANIAETAILARNACFPDSVVGFVPDLDKSDAFYIKMFLDSIKQKMQNVSRGTTQDNLSLEKLLRFQIPTPPFSQLLRFREVVTPLYDQVLVLSKKNDTLRTTRDLLLPKLVSGQLDVEHLDIDMGDVAPVLEEALS
jgi:type I restriction enzyme, S subunit